MRTSRGDYDELRPVSSFRPLGQSNLILSSIFKYTNWMEGSMEEGASDQWVIDATRFMLQQPRRYSEGVPYPDQREIIWQRLLDWDCIPNRIRNQLEEQA